MQLTRQAILDAAFEILNAYGFPDMTMRRVATQLGVAPGALYWHVANKQELISAIGEEIVADLVTADPSISPGELSEIFRNCLLRHRDGAEVVTASMSQPDSPVHSIVRNSFFRSIQSQVQGQLQGQEESKSANEHDALATAHGLVHLTLGSVLLEQSRQQFIAATNTPDLDDSAETALLSRRSIEIFLAGLNHS